MSTKIYDGIRLKHMSMIELNAYIKDLRNEMIPIATREFEKVYTELFEKMVVYLQTGVQLPINSEFSYLELKTNSFKDVRWKAIEESRRILKQNKRAETIVEYERDFDFIFDLYVFPIKRKLLAYPNLENPTLREYFFSKPEITEYGYWDNTDRPDNLSSDSWRRRKENWDLALPGIGMLSENGMCFKVIDPTIHIDWFAVTREKIVSNLTDPDILKTQVAKQVILDEKMKEFKEIYPKDGDVESKDLDCYFKARNFIHDNPSVIEARKDDYIIDVKAFVENKD